MTTKTINRVTLPDGRIAQRVSARAYTHAVIVDEPNGAGVYGWSSSAAGAEKTAAAARKAWPNDTVTIAAVN